MLERDALERFVDEYGHHAYNFAYSLCGNEPDANELVQDAFVKIFNKSDCYDTAQPLESWFNTVLKNLYLDGRRRWEYRRALSLDLEIEGLTVADSLPDVREEAPLDKLQREETAARVRDALASLPRAHQAVLRLVDVEGLGYQAAARALGCTVGTVRSRLNRGRRALREKLLTTMEEP